MDEIIKKVLQYDATTGKLVWLIKAAKNTIVGSEAGGVGHHNYRTIRINKQLYYSHRVAWFLHYGVWPTLIDHINGNKSDNRIENLREVSQSFNLQNKQKRKNTSSKYQGVRWHNRGYWVAEIKIDKKYKYIGRFDTQEDAAQAYNFYAYDVYGPQSRQNSWVA